MKIAFPLMACLFFSQSNIYPVDPAKDRASCPPLQLAVTTYQGSNQWDFSINNACNLLILCREGVAHPSLHCCFFFHKNQNMNMTWPSFHQCPGEWKNNEMEKISGLQRTRSSKISQLCATNLCEENKIYTFSVCELQQSNLQTNKVTSY